MKEGSGVKKAGKEERIHMNSRRALFLNKNPSVYIACMLMA